MSEAHPPPPPPDLPSASSGSHETEGRDADGRGPVQSGWLVLDTGDIVELASRRQRVAARVIDWLIIWALMVAIAVGLATAARASEDSESSDADAAQDETVTDAEVAALVGTLSVSIWLISLVYETVAIATKGQTLGKLAARIKVVRTDNGRVPGWKKSTGRCLAFGVWAAIPGLNVIVLLVIHVSMLLSKRRQGLHDKASGTVVITRL
ncbi:MAG: RDD family protein [Acidimicrobiaceae bacterium]|nr:RDD family protein [Acidimicrobiaceae bacterium]MXZ66702.1 RDD family protein [Acidimicrobiaceae bacterium]MYF33274.1 RDD family protein [Acidimicrobiaceae bacterium]MYG79984.1 RDD family protein [Acidimicrobiaceae bacterium]MYJ83736.1 RDD family protein [Acidimicrobiaceae bacterium]